MSAKPRTLGKTNVQLFPIGLGCMSMSICYGKPADKEQAFRTIELALQSGINMFDTADIYGDNELLLAEAIKKFGREKFFLATKFALRLTETGLSVCGKKEYVKEACNKSLQRLGIDYIDLYYQHRVDPTTPIEETVEAMAELVAEGKVRHLGLSEASSEQLRRAYAVHPIAALQTEYSLWSVEVEESILKTCRELGITLVAYSPLGRGFLSGAIKSRDDFEPDDWRLTNPRFSEENFPKNLKLVDNLKQLAESKKCTSSQLALAWVLSRGDDVIPIPGTTKEHHLKELIDSLQVTITQEDDAKIREWIKEVCGDRYAQMNSVGRS